MRIIILLLISVASIQPIFSQPELPINGFIITINNDTISGNIKSVDKGNHITKIKFWNPKDKQTHNYKAIEVKGFCYDNRYFESLIWQEMHYYFERIVKGQVSLYLSAYTIFGPPHGTPDKISEYFILDHSTLIKVKEVFFRKQMVNFTKACPALSNKIDKGELVVENLKQIIEEYNLCVK